MVGARPMVIEQQVLVAILEQSAAFIVDAHKSMQWLPTNI